MIIIAIICYYIKHQLETKHIKNYITVLAMI